MSPDPLHWFRSRPPEDPPEPDDEPPQTLLGVPPAAPWLEDVEWDEPKPETETDDP